MSIHYQKILNYFDNRSTNASAESFSAKIKAFRAQFRGVKNIPFFLFSLSTTFAWLAQSHNFYDWFVTISSTKPSLSNSFILAAIEGSVYSIKAAVVLLILGW